MKMDFRAFIGYEDSGDIMRLSTRTKLLGLSNKSSPENGNSEILISYNSYNQDV